MIVTLAVVMPSASTVVGEAAIVEPIELGVDGFTSIALWDP